MKKRWRRFWGRWLPARCREMLEAENERLAAALAAEQAERQRLEAYLDGVETALHAARRIVIYTGDGSPENRSLAEPPERKENTG